MFFLPYYYYYYDYYFDVLALVRSMKYLTESPAYLATATVECKTLYPLRLNCRRVKKKKKILNKIFNASSANTDDQQTVQICSDPRCLFWILT